MAPDNTHESEQNTQGNLFEFEAPSDDNRAQERADNTQEGDDQSREYTLQTHQVHLITMRLESGDDSYLLHPTDSLSGIAKLQNYSRYHTGARRKVVNAKNWRSKGQTPEERSEMLSKKSELKQDLGAAHINSDQTLRRKIAESVRFYDIERLSDMNQQPQGIPARMRNASKDVVEYAPFTFAQEIRSNKSFSRKLSSLAKRLDARLNEGKRNDYAVTNAFELAVANPDNTNAEAARLIYSLGEFWTAHASRMNEVWQDALARYNSQFPERAFDPYDPKYALRDRSKSDYEW